MGVVINMRDIFLKPRIPGPISGPVQIAAGGMGMSIFGGTCLGLLFSGLIHSPGGGLMSATFMVAWAFLFPPAILSCYLLGKGILTRNRVQRLQKYFSIWKDRSYIMFSDLSDESGENMKRIRQDINYITDHQLLPGARIDQDETCLLLTEEAIALYEAARESRRQREEEQKKRDEILRQWEGADEKEKEMYSFLSEAEATLKELDRYQLRLASPNMGPRLDQMELGLTRIFVCVKNHPEKLRLVRRLMTYYLPTQMNLLSVYEDLEKQPVQGDNISKTREEIEASTDTFNQALTTMFDELFQEDALNISADIQVLRMMLTRDGWISEE
jgi:5-bromo-4-chloroindolyl phosphate hydrolysis protein